MNYFSLGNGTQLPQYQVPPNFQNNYAQQQYYYQQHMQQQQGGPGYFMPGYQPNGMQPGQMLGPPITNQQPQQPPPNPFNVNELMKSKSATPPVQQSVTPPPPVSKSNGSSTPSKAKKPKTEVKKLNFFLNLIQKYI